MPPIARRHQARRRVLLAPTLLALALVASLPAGGAQSGPRVVLDAPVVVAGLPFAAHLEGLDPYLEPSLVANGDFDADLSGWSANFDEVGGSGFAQWGTEAGHGGFVRLSLKEPNSEGTAYLWQAVAATAAPAFLFSYEARSQDGDARLAMLVRETDAAGLTQDTRFDDLVTPDWSRSEWSFVPRSNVVDRSVFLRMVVQPGSNYTVDFDRVRLQPMPAIRWEAPGAKDLRPDGLRVKVSFEFPGLYPVDAIGSRAGTDVYRASTVVEVVNRPPEASLRMVEPQRSTTQAHVFDATGSFDPDEPVQLRDVEFRNVGEDWRIVAQEVQPRRMNANVQLRDDGLTWLDLDVATAQRTGTVYVVQSVALAVPTPLAWSVLARDDGGIVEYEVLLRERTALGNESDTSYSFQPTRGVTRLLSGTWTPKTSEPVELSFYLRAVIFQGDSSKFSFAKPRLHSGLRFEWTLDSQPPLVLGVPVWQTFVHTPGPHRLELRVLDGLGVADNASLEFVTGVPQAVWGFEPPAVMPRRVPLELNASRLLRLGDENAVTNPSFDAGLYGWRVAADQPSNELASVLEEDEDPFLRVRSNASQRVAVYARQDLGEACLDMTCELKLRFRSPDADALVAVIVRAVAAPDARNPNGRTVDRSFQAAPTADWNEAFLSFSFKEARTDFDEVQLFLRYVAPKGRVAYVDFDDVVVRPGLQYRWSASGGVPSPLPSGPVQRIMFVESGPKAVHASVTDPWNLTLANTWNIEVLELDSYRTLQGEVGLRWPMTPSAATSASRIELLDRSGNVLWRQSLAEAADLSSASFTGRTLGAAPYEYVVLPGPLVQRSAQTVLHVASAFNASDLRDQWQVDSPLRGRFYRSAFEHQRVGPQESLRLEVVVEDLSILTIGAELRRGAEVVASAPLSGSEGTFRGDLVLPADLGRGSYQLHYRMTDVFGRSVVLVDPRPYKIDPSNPLLVVGLVLAAAALLIGAGVGARAWKRRRM